MGKNKILIISIVSAAILICILFAVIFFASDLFKSDKALFYKYASQIDLKDIVDLDSYNAYQKRLESEGHGNDGSFTVSLIQGEENINESIKYSGYTDPINNKTNYDISINKDGEALLDMNYLRSQDLYGILFKDVVSQYIVVENNNLKEFAGKFGIENTDNIPDKIESTKVSNYINYDELKPIFQKYLNFTIEQIDDGNYSKIKKEEITVGEKTINADGYQIKLKYQEVKLIIRKVLEEAINDEDTFNQIAKVNSGITFEEYQSNLQDIIDELSDESSNEEANEFITISVYKKGRKTLKLCFDIELDETSRLEISIDKVSNGTILKCEYKLDENSAMVTTLTNTQNSNEQANLEIVISSISEGQENAKFTINIERTGALTDDNVSHTINISTALEDTSINLKFENTTNFSKAPEFQEFSDGNYVVINELSKEQLDSLFTNLGALVSERLQGIDFLSPISGIFSVLEMKESMYDAAAESAESTKNALEEEGALFESSGDSMAEATNAMSNQVVATFNAQFTAFEGTRKGSEIKSLINTANMSNTTNADHIVDYGNITADTVEPTKTYNVSFEKDADGYINKAIITETE